MSFPRFERTNRGSVAFVVAAWLAVAFGCNLAHGQSASDLDIGALAKEGEDIAKRDQEAGKRVELLAREGDRVQRDQATVGNDLVSWNKGAQDFNARCGHPFYSGQEAEVARCQGEYDRSLANLKELLAKQQSLQDQEKNWKTRKDEADRRKIDVTVEMQAWKSRVRALSVVAGTQACLSGVNPQASSEEVVHAYRRCWDGAGNAPALDLTNPRRGGATPNAPAPR